MKQISLEEKVNNILKWLANQIACNNRYFTNFSNSNDSHSVATSLAVVDLDANTYKKI